MESHEIVFDFSHIEGSLDVLDQDPVSFNTTDNQPLGRLATLPAVDHMLHHMDRFGIGPVPDRAELTRSLLSPAANRRARVALVKAALREARLCTTHRDDWLPEVLDLLPPGHVYRGTTLYFTHGYDIGVVSSSRDASVNLAHPRICEHPETVTLYVMHELHHVGFLTHHSIPRVRDVASRADLVRLIQGLTFMEGLGMYAPLLAREHRGALNRDPDYVTLGDAGLMVRLRQEFWHQYDRLEDLPQQVSTDQVVAVLERFGAPHKLFHLVGADLVRQVDEQRGRARLHDVIVNGPQAFVALARALS